MKTIELFPLERFILLQAMLDPEQRINHIQMRQLNKVLDVLEFSDDDIAACGRNDVAMGPMRSGVVFHEPNFVFELRMEDAVFDHMYARAQAHNRWPPQNSRVVESLFDELEEAKRGTVENT